MQRTRGQEVASGFVLFEPAIRRFFFFFFFLEEVVLSALSPTFAQKKIYR